MRRVPIRIKLLGALAVPLLGLLSIIVFELAKTSRDVREVRSQTHLATATIGPSGLLNVLQDERTWAVAALSGAEDSVTLEVTGYPETRGRTDEALASFRDAMDDGGGDIAAVYRPALDRMSDLPALRQEIDDHIASSPGTDLAFADTMFRRYADLTQPFLDANTRLALAIDSPGLRQGAELIDLSSRQIETMAGLVRSLVQGGQSGRIEEREELVRVATLTEVFELNAAAIRDTRRDPYRDLVEDQFPEQATTGLLETAEAAIAGEPVDVARVQAATDVPVEDSYVGFRNETADLLDSEADRLQGGASGRGWLFRLFALVAVVVAGLATWWVSRSITRPLRSLTRQATDMANHRLPDAVLDILDTPLGDDVTVPQVEPITVQTRDEVADVADALNTVQDSALDLAVEQAVLRRNIADSFVNLGRRNQNLLGRQLDFITELEHNETDPDTLANLFRLDHLATRMRRNAESLLVLAGIDPPRKWAAPVRVTDAIRAALGEVEDYQRVTVRQVEPATVMGSAAADLAHLLAELIENALIFSPPDQTVEIRGRSQPAGYTLAIIDSGLGMPPDELARANRRLAGAESFTIAPSKYLGHYVAGNLAARHNINVTLHNSPGHGITATINLPPTLLTSSDVSAPAPVEQDDAAPGAPQLRTEFVPRAEDQPPVAPRSNGRETPMPVGAGAGPSLGSPAGPRAGGAGSLDDLAPAAAANLVDEQTAGGLTKRSRADGPPAIPTRPNRPKPPAPDDALLQTLAAYTTGLHSAVGDAPPSPRPADEGGVPTEPILSPSAFADDAPGGPPMEPRHVPSPSPSVFDQPAPDPGVGRDRDRDRGRSSSPFDAPPVGPPTEPILSPSAFDRGPDQGRSPFGAPPAGTPLQPSTSPFDAPPVGAPARRAPASPPPPPPSPRRSDRSDLDDLDAGPPTQPVSVPAPAAFDRGGLDRLDDGPPPLGALFDDGDDADDLDDPFDAPLGSRPGARGVPARAFDGSLAPLDPPVDPPRARDRAADPRGLPADREWATPPPAPAPRRSAPSGPLGDPSPPPLGRRPEPGPGPAGPGAPESPAATASGLQRRVRGAQMPMTEPVNLRRGRGDAGRGDADRKGAGRGGRGAAPAAPSSPSTGAEPPEPNGDHRAADEVYGFLSSFTAGVQRGLDESNRDEGDERERRRRTR